ncbi:competence type IV pilus major pilin ComGC [Niallia endozanthoxylica]|uniref:ComG operon protein 3 n=1 Tax=Niallia endozanthoxylica TaxID=2036016 RepID=A0A5J5HXA7_9BACI|nr:competence type IV pilus major pilin ComGC [Niallia endozanthoxylica]KAA9026278.1 prepilin-type N-terminal cleavage/methylation domain-containing protein [Niallia endozanthoxylica]
MLKSQKGFTLIEMMIVLLVISILLMITVPNVTKNNSTINEKGCEAYLKMVEGQVQSYKMENHAFPTVQQLIDDDYIEDNQCPQGKKVAISAEGVVSLEKSTEE